MHIRQPRSAGFTVVELLAVVAVIGLLIAILVPALGKARQAAKKLTTRTDINAIATGLEAFKTDNASDPACMATGGYPSSAVRDDPTVPGDNYLLGAQWVVRYMVGKDGAGYIPEKNVPRQLVNQPEAWYESDISRAGPYVPAGRVPTVQLRGDEQALPGAPSSLHGDYTADSGRQPVFVDSFGGPLLYYAANAGWVGRAGVSLAQCRRSDSYKGIYVMEDNGLLTGMCLGNACFVPPWDLAELTPGNGVGDSARYPFSHFGAGGAPTASDVAAADRHSFIGTILDEDAFASNGERIATPVQPRGFLMISAGPDRIFGTEDDVTNFN